MRLLAVTDARPQKNWPTTAMKTKNLAVPVLTALEINLGAALTRNGSLASPKMIPAYASVSPFFGSAAIIDRFNTIAAIAEM